MTSSFYNSSLETVFYKEIDKITFVIPSRNNLEFLKLAYKSISNLDREYTEIFEGCASVDKYIAHDILILNDASNDGTQEWLDSLEDENLIVYTNQGPDRVGIVGMFDKGIEMARTDIIFAFHADMVASSDLDMNILKYLDRGKVITATRVEPPLHPPGPEKIVEDYGVEVNEFNFQKWLSGSEKLKEHKKTNGIFAPWCMYKDDFLAVGGHDELFAPQSREDSDLFNRFKLKGYELIQSWEALVYHFTSRGSRFNKHSGGDTGKDSPEWQYTNHKNSRNFIRKWGTIVQHDEHMMPIITPKYNIGFVVSNCSASLLEMLEPWCSTIYTDWGWKTYIDEEQKNTTLDLKERVKSRLESKVDNDIVVEFDGSKLDQDGFMFIQKLPHILSESGEIGEMEHDIFKLKIKSLNTYEEDYIK